MAPTGLHRNGSDSYLFLQLVGLLAEKVEPRPRYTAVLEERLLRVSEDGQKFCIT